MIEKRNVYDEYNNQYSLLAKEYKYTLECIKEKSELLYEYCDAIKESLILFHEFQCTSRLKHKATTFKNFRGKGKYDYKSIDDLLLYIKNNPHKDQILQARLSGKDNTVLDYTFAGKPTNLYNYTKSIIPAVVFGLQYKANLKSCQLDKYGENVDGYSGYMYLDVDTFYEEDKNEFTKTGTKILTFEETVNTLKSIPYVKAVWKSFGGNGLGILVETIGALHNINYKESWVHIEKLFADLGIIIDSQTKNPNRMNVLSYDPDIYINENVIPITTKIEETLDYYTNLQKEKNSTLNYEVITDENRLKNYLFDKIHKLNMGTNNRNKPAGLFIRYNCLRKGIDFDLVDEVINDKRLDFLDFEDLAELNRQLRYCYTTYDHEFGINPIKIYKGNNSQKKINYILEDNKKLSHLNINYAKKNILIAPTGSGKTTSICNKANRNNRTIIVVPTQSALKQIKKDFPKAEVYYEEKKSVRDISGLVVTTISSFSRVINIYNHDKSLIDPNKYNIYIDEAHTFASSSSKSFRLDELQYLYQAIDLFNSAVFMTGTYIPTILPILNNAVIHNVVRRNPKKTICTPVYFEKYESVFGHIKDNIIKGQLNFLFLDSIKWESTLGNITEYFKTNNITYRVYNSTTKKTPIHNQIDNKSYIREKCDVVIMTSIALEAININNDNIGNFFILPTRQLNYLNPHLKEQLVNRLRKIKPEMVFDYFKKPNGKSNAEFDILGFQDKINRNLENIIDRFKNTLDNNIKQSFNKPLRKTSLEDYIANGIFNHNMLVSNNLIQLDIYGNINIDYISIYNLAFNCQTYNAANSLSLNTKILNQFNWIFEDEIWLDVKEEDENLKEEIKGSNTIRKAMIHELVDHVCNKIKEESEVTIKQIRIDKKDSPKYYSEEIFEDIPIDYFNKIENAVINKITTLSSFMSWENAIEKIQKIKLSERLFNRTIRQIHIELWRQLPNDWRNKSNNTLEVKFIQNMFNLYGKYKDKKMLLTEFRDIIAEQTGMITYKKIKTNVIIDVLKNFFTIKKSGRKVINNVSHNTYVIENDNPLNIEINLEKEFVPYIKWNEGDPYITDNEGIPNMDIDVILSTKYFKHLRKLIDKLTVNNYEQQSTTYVNINIK